MRLVTFDPFVQKHSYGHPVSFKSADEDPDSLSRKAYERQLARDRAVLTDYARWQPHMVAPYADSRLNDALNDAIIRDRPLGHGGVHIAYGLYSAHNPQVIKMDTLRIRHWIRNYSAALIPEWVAWNMRQYIDKERQHIQEFEDAFNGGKIIVPKQQIFMGTVQLGDDMLLKLGAKPDQLPKLGSIPTFYRLVPFIRELDPNHFQPSYNQEAPLISQKRPIPAEDFRDIKTRYAEQRPQGAPPLSLVDWQRANEIWLTFSRQEDFDGELLNRVQYGGSLGKLLNECRNDRVRQAVEEFIRKAIRYSEKTGKIVDIMGAQNAFIDFNDKIVLHDALYSENAPILDDAAKLFRKFAEGGKPTALEWYAINDLANAFNYVRSINALAQGLGMRERLTTFRFSQPVHWENILDIIRHHWRFFSNTRLHPITGNRNYKPSGT